MFDLRRILGLASHAMPHLGGMGPAQKGVSPIQQGVKSLGGLQPMQYAQYMNQGGTGGGFGPNNPSQGVSQPIQMGQVQGTENYVPQDPTAPMSDPTDTQNYLQAAYNNPQTSLNGNFQQQAPQQNLQQSADPYGWLRSQLRY